MDNHWEECEQCGKKHDPRRWCDQLKFYYALLGGLFIMELAAIGMFMYRYIEAHPWP